MAFFLMENCEKRLFFKVNVKKDISPMKEFHKHIQICQYETNNIQLIDFIRIIENMPLCFSASNNRTNGNDSKINIHIYCSKCTNLKIFKTIVDVHSNYAEIHLHSLCAHTIPKLVEVIGNKNIYLLDFFESNFDRLCLKNKRPPGHPFREISQKILKKMKQIK